MSLVSAATTSIVDSTQARREDGQKPSKPQPLERKETMFDAEWVDEVGSKEDIEALGRFVAELLSKRHYQWVSKRYQVESLLEHILPELDVSTREAYTQSHGGFFNACCKA